MTVELRVLAPSLGGQVTSRSGNEPGLSRMHRAERKGAVASHIGLLRSELTHDRFSGVLALADYADFPRAVGGMIRSVCDDSCVVSLAAIYALGKCGTRLAVHPLCDHAITALACILNEEPPRKIGVLALRLFRYSLAMPDSAAGRALWVDLLRHARSGEAMYLPDYAMAALRNIGTPDALALISADPPNNEESSNGESPV